MHAPFMIRKALLYACCATLVGLFVLPNCLTDPLCTVPHVFYIQSVMSATNSSSCTVRGTVDDMSELRNVTVSDRAACNSFEPGHQLGACSSSSAATDIKLPPLVLNTLPVIYGGSALCIFTIVSLATLSIVHISGVLRSSMALVKVRTILTVISRLSMLAILLALSLPYCLSDVDCTVADTMQITGLASNIVTGHCELSGMLVSRNSSVDIYDAPLSACKHTVTNSTIDVCYSAFRSAPVKMAPFFLNNPLVVVGGTVLALALSSWIVWMLVSDVRGWYVRSRIIP